MSVGITVPAYRLFSVDIINAETTMINDPVSSRKSLNPKLNGSAFSTLINNDQETDDWTDRLI